MEQYLKELVKGVLAFVSSCVGIFGYFPMLPAYFAVCNMDGRVSLPVFVGTVAGMICFMPLAAMVKYFFVLVVVALGIRFFRWVNHSCDSWGAGVIAAVATVAMNFTQTPFWGEHVNELLMGICEGILVFGLCLGIHGLLGVSFQWQSLLKQKREYTPVRMHTRRGARVEKMENLAYAVAGLSDAFYSMSYPSVGGIRTKEDKEACLECESREICWREQHGKELKNAWNNKVKENRFVVAQQLQAMATLLEEWTKVRVSADSAYSQTLVQIVYAAKEKGLVVEDLHIYEENERLCVEGYVSTRWNGGIPVKHYLHIVEKVIGRPMRIGKDAKNILSKEAVFMVLYEDTKFYALQGIATEKKSDSVVNGDSFSFFSMDDGNYHICLSDGMGSGSRANQESEMIVELMQKFIEAGFQKEVAVKMMNSAMLLQGEEESFSTLDYGVIDMYTGDLELTKIGGATTFIKHGQEVECIDCGSLPTGAQMTVEVEHIKRKLSNGDFLVMVTDGVIEYLHVRNPKEVVSDIIGLIKTENAGVLAEQLLQQIMIRNGGVAKDDITILVTGIWEK